MHECDPIQFHNSTAMGNRNVISNNPRNLSQTLDCTYKSIPVYKIGIQFDGEPGKLLSFIESRGTCRSSQYS